MAGWRSRARTFVEAPRVQKAIIALIALNAVTLGLETSPAAMAAAGPLLLTLDRVLLAIFTVEIAVRIFAHGHRFFRDAWSLFDFIVVGIAWVPLTEGFAVLRALRVLRVLRIITAVPRMRMVVQALLSAIPGISSIVALLALIFYVAAVMVTKLFGPSFPDWFGSIPKSLYSLFQIMTLESWSMGIVRPVMEQYPYAWLFFVPFILIATFTMLNLFIAVVVSAMQSEHEAEHRQVEEEAHDERRIILAEVKELRRQMAALQQRLDPGLARRDQAE
ncbi:MAG: ion transporter [Rhodospirillales bacterium]|nr:MAG: ion transporter [Rhodospirillales bacterium]